ncbi:HlyD family secretion protein [Chitinophaga tropicalis]|uniref:HlyD family efflux transporter periplasmic adaptor subunit n=1 Tax=Chitinophaga tropicalis TaxID=2683588 RepID=A0A7K1U2I0_9BACT|nr:HlyD family efflux transporter periplasmic adaptor subunit [Chitinophaga tropicalis]MVT08574.1 HlyD family efflux transporter periplasmic adaptor subunit [Chitinophaga tropicalis]
MPSLFPAAIMERSVFTWLPRVKTGTQVIYIIVLLVVLIALAALPFIYVDVSVSASGLVRPIAEKTELYNLVAGTIEEVLVTDGASIRSGQVLMRLRQDINDSKMVQNSFEISQRELQIHDLSLLAAGSGGASLRSAQYRQQYSQYISSLSEQAATVDKLRADMNTYEKLFHEKVVARQEYLDRKYEYEKSRAAYQSAIQQQRSVWSNELNQLRLEDNRLRAENHQLSKEKEWNLIKAPVSGTLQQFTGKYPGGFVRAGELLGVISPDSSLLAECYVSPRDIGYLEKGMPVSFQVDAFNYNEWGIVKGKVLSVDNDFTLVNNEPVFKVKCSFVSTELSTPKGIKASLKKGMTLQSRFILTRRSLFQLLYDKADDWVNPNRKKA